jgi:5-methylcytosine-specific restriction endonuclease McrA
MKFSDLDLRSVGHEVQLVGGIWAGNGKAFLCYFPEYGQEFEPVVLEMNLDDWKALIRQSDLVETEVLAKAPNGDLIKTVIRKCERNIDAAVTAKVYERDGFKCRYCGRSGIPLTVDHLVLFEERGPATEENLVTACRKCNKRRGRMQYKDWLDSDYYKNVSKGLDAHWVAENRLVDTTLDAIPRMAHVRSR